MKIETATNTKFKPFNITIETKEEAMLMAALFGNLLQKDGKQFGIDNSDVFYNLLHDQFKDNGIDLRTCRVPFLRITYEES
jgi:hypothetical protein